MICKHSEKYDLYKFLPEPTFFDDFETPLNIIESMATLACCNRSVRKHLFSSSRSPFDRPRKAASEASQKRPRNVPDTSKRRPRGVPAASQKRPAPDVPEASQRGPRDVLNTSQRFKAQGSRPQAQGSRFKAQGSRLKAQGSWPKAQGSRLKVHSLTK